MERPPTEHERLLAEHRRREREIPPQRYAPWDPAEMLMRAERKRLAATLLRRAGAFPQPSTPCLEVGYGRLGWLADLLGWGVGQASLYGIELDPERSAVARAALPAADLRTGDAADLPWHDGTFGLVVLSTVFSSVLDADRRRRMADEAGRVLRPGGALVFYDFRYDNPRNPAVRGVGRREIRRLFPALRGPIASTTLAPPLARRVAGVAPRLAVLLEGLPFLRTHLLAVLQR